MKFSFKAFFESDPFLHRISLVDHVLCLTFHLFQLPPSLWHSSRPCVHLFRWYRTAPRGWCRDVQLHGGGGVRYHRKRRTYGLEECHGDGGSWKRWNVGQSTWSTTEILCKNGSDSQALNENFTVFESHLMVH